MLSVVKILNTINEQGYKEDDFVTVGDFKESLKYE